MPTTQQDLEEQERRLRQAGAKATQLSGIGSTFMANVREELRRRAQEKGVSELGKAAAATRKEFVEAPARIREQYPTITPTKRMSLEAERRGSILAELTEIADLKAQRQASITDILGGMRGGIEAEAAREAQRFTMEQTLYQNMFGRYQSELENTWKQKQFDQANEQMEINKNYNDAMLALQEDNLELANQKFEEAKRHELIAEQLDRDRIALEEELTYAQLASQQKIAGMTGGGGRTEQQTVEEMAAKWAVKGKIMEGIQNGNVTSAEDIQASIASGGFDPNDAFFADLYSGVVQPTPTTPTSDRWNIPAQFSALRQLVPQPLGQSPFSWLKGKLGL